MLLYLQNSYAYSAPPLLGFLVLLSLSLVALCKGKRNRTTLLFAGLCFLGALINADVALVSLIPEESVALKVDRATYFFFVFSLPIFIQFVHVFIGITGRAWLERLAYLFSLTLLFFIPTDLFISGLNIYSFGRIAQAGPLYYAFMTATGISVSYCLFTLFSAMHRARENELKNRIKYILGGIGLSIVLLVANILPILGFPIYPPGNFSFIPAIVLAFGVLKYDLLDMNAFLRHSLFYFILTALLTVSYVVIIYFFNSVLVPSGKSTVVLPFFLAIFMVFLFNPLHQKVQQGIDNFFFRGRYDYQQLLKKISGDLASLLKLHQVRDLLLQSITAALQVEIVFLLLYDRATGVFNIATDNQAGTANALDIVIDRTHPLVIFLEKQALPLSKIAVERLPIPLADRQAVRQFFDTLQVAMLVPLLSAQRLVGIIALGEKKSGELLVQEDMELLTTIANQSVTAIENALAYEEIEELNRELERKVAQRTASLRKTLEEKEKTQQQLIQSESLAAIGQLVAGAAHELNNPLAGASSLIQSSLETIEKAKPNQEEVVDDLRFSLKELRRMGEIVGSLLDLSRKTQVYVEPVLANLALDDALRILYNQYKYLPVEIEKNYDENLPVIEGNFANLGQVFINVVKNALQSLPDGKGKIILSTHYAKDSDRVVIECRDTGRGIPGALQKDIFKPFFTTKTVGEGTGLGLYVSHEIIKRHGGSMDVTSVENIGTSMVIELPCHRRQT